jgi:hypothetical protein
MNLRKEPISRRKQMYKFEAKVSKRGSTITNTVVIEAKNTAEAKRLLEGQYQGHMISSIRQIGR